jgi:hypothetical protein
LARVAAAWRALPEPIRRAILALVSTAGPLDFTAAFDRLDREAGAHNFVSLVELRRALPWDRPTFDAELRKLRLAGRYTLSAAEGRHGISAQEKAAGMVEDGALLLYVSRAAQK